LSHRELRNHLWNEIVLLAACIIHIAMESVLVLVLMLSIRGYLWIADLGGVGNESLVQVIHQYSWIGLAAIYAIVVIHGIVLFARLTWTQLHENAMDARDKAGLSDTCEDAGM
jgi:hypothetical protein